MGKEGGAKEGEEYEDGGADADADADVVRSHICHDSV